MVGMPSAPSQILYIIVNYRRASLCADLANHVLSLPRADAVHAVIVDNSEQAEDAALLAALPRRSNLSIATPPSNLGYFGGAAFGFESYVASSGLPAWSVVSNPDIDFPDGTFVANLLDQNGGADVGVLAPDIRMTPDCKHWKDGFAQNPFMERRPSRAYLFTRETASRIPFLYTLMVLRNRLKMRRAKAKAPVARQLSRRSIYAPHGSAIVFARRYFECGGTLRYGAFLYGEEIFVAEELRLRGLKCILEPDLRLCHIGGATTVALGLGRQGRFNYEALSFLRKRYFNGTDV